MAGAGTPGWEGTPMLTVVPVAAGALPAGEQPSSLIGQIVRDGARPGHGRAEAVQLGDPAAVGVYPPPAISGDR